ncbi:flagellar filament capping protein FliD [Vogesella mureinivorans]|uniref:flagellar filament capping protein FliD n=1 Tax=Vogesella mureinivorans TaxID=657276 RepID=UPI0011CB45FE|nr:flagellar filament capping protein FliD [Vogesella mureinivorans]
MASITTAGSNFDVQGLVSQLMSLEQAPLTASKKRQSEYNNQLSSLGKLKSTLSDFQTSMRGLLSGTALNVTKAESSDSTTIKATSDFTASAGTYVMNVTSLASAQTLALSSYAGGSGAIASATTALGNTAGNLTFSFGDGKTGTVALSAGASLQDISSAINSAGLDVAASVVNSGAEGYKLALTSKNSGNAGAFSLSGGAALGVGFLDFDRTSSDAANLAKRTAAPSDAVMTINGVTVTASSNKVSGVMTGLDVTLYKTGAATLTVTRDNDTVLKNVQAFVDGYNKIDAQVDEMYKQTGSTVTDASGKTIGTTSRVDGSVRMLMQSLSNELNTGISGQDLSSGFGFMSQIGISLQKDGTLKLDSEVFKKALDKDPVAVARVFSNPNEDGFADRLNKKVSDMQGTEGMLQMRTTSLNQQVRYETQRQQQIQAALDDKQKALLGQYSRLDAALAKMKTQSSYLSAGL